MITRLHFRDAAGKKRVIDTGLDISCVNEQMMLAEWIYAVSEIDACIPILAEQVPEP